MQISRGEITVKVRELGPLGDGVAPSGRGKLFIDNGLPGDVVRARPYRTKDGAHRAEIKEVLEPSPLRSTPSCPHFEACGNCSLQHLKVAEYQAWKSHLVRESLAAAGIHADEVEAPLFLQGPLRRRANLTAQWRQGKLLFGYYGRRSQTLTAVSQCEVLAPELWKLRDQIAPYLNLFVPPQGPLNIFFQLVAGKTEVLFTGQLKRGFSSEALVDLGQTLGLSRIAVRSEFSVSPRVLYEAEEMTAGFEGVQVALPAGAFLQATEAGERALVEFVRRALPRQGPVADLFSGCGTFSGVLASVAETHAYEDDPAAMRALAVARGSKHSIRTHLRDLMGSPLSRKELAKFSVVVFDPPRCGAERQARELAQSAVPTVIAIACNVGTFTRDAVLLVRGGYRLKRLRLIDQFQWSHHVELAAEFVRNA